jgi:hypothetical protein
MLDRLYHGGATLASPGSRFGWRSYQDGRVVQLLEDGGPNRLWKDEGDFDKVWEDIRLVLHV